MSFAQLQQACVTPDKLPMSAKAPASGASAGKDDDDDSLLDVKMR
jgi:hypothetical protein